MFHTKLGRDRQRKGKAVDQLKSWPSAYPHDYKNKRVIISERPSKNGHWERITKPYTITSSFSPDCIRIKRSSKWCTYDKKRTRTNWFTVPFINKFGVITFNEIARWKCYPHQLFATLVATLYQRYKVRMKRNRQLSKRNYLRLRTALEVAGLAVLKNDYFLYLRLSHRVLHGGKGLKQWAYRCRKNLDTTERFLIGQLFNNGSWLQSRVERPRAKSRKIRDVRPLRTNKPFRLARPIEIEDSHRALWRWSRNFLVPRSLSK